MIRLLMGVTLSETGGTQRVVYDIIANLPERDYDITLVTSPGGELLDWIARLNGGRTSKIKVVTDDCLRREISLSRDSRAFVRMLRLVRGAGFDVAHFHNSKMGIIGRLAARMAGIPKIYYTVHGWGLNPRSTGKLFAVMSLLEKAVARLSTEVIFVSESDRQTGLRNGWARKQACRLIHNGIDPDWAESSVLRSTLSIPADVPVVIFVARLAQPKDPLFAIRVSGRLRDMGVAHRLVIIGDGPLGEPCRTLAAELGLDGQVILAGRRNDVRTLLGGADLFCLFTQWEGLPISIIEAMFAGLPVVASSVGGIPELVEHGVTGYVLDGFDEGEAAALLQKLLGDERLRKNMGASGRAAALTRFTVDAMAEGYRRLYES